MLAVIFWPEEAAAVRAWSETTAYNYCFLVVPTALYLAWERRQGLATALPHPSPWLALTALPVAFFWLVAERASIMEARQLLAMSLVQILFLAVLGPSCWRRLSAPLLYLFFLVPFGEFLIPYLQIFTAHFMARGLDLLQIPNYSSGTVIEIPEGAFRVAQACAGLRFLIASAAFGVLYACLMYTSLLRRLVFVALSLVVPVIANGFRALGLVVLAHLLGSAAAVETDHILYGYLFFSIVTFLLILLGLPFRQPARHTVRLDRPSGRNPAVGITVTAVMVLIAAAPRLLADRLDNPAAHQPITANIPVSIPPDCTPAPLPAASPARLPVERAGTAASRAYRCTGGIFVVTLRDYPARIAARPLIDLFSAQTVSPGSPAPIPRTYEIGAGAATPHWHVTEFQRGKRYAAIATALWIDGRPAGSAITDRLRQAVNALRPTPVPPVAAIVTYDAAGSPEAGDQALNRFLTDWSRLYEYASPPETAKKDVAVGLRNR